MYCIIILHFYPYKNSRDSSAGIALGYGLDDRDSRVRFPVGGVGIFLFTASRTALGPTKPPIQRVSGAPSLGVKRPGREADHSPPSSAEVKEWVDLYFHSPNTSSWRDAQLKHRDNFTFYMYRISQIGPTHILKSVTESLTYEGVSKSFRTESITK
jgi:hypothetical protein